VLEELDAGVTSAPVYYDYQAIVEHNPEPGFAPQSARLGSDDRFEILVRDPLAQDPALGGNLAFGTKFYNLQAVYQGQLNSSVELYSMLSFSRNAFDFSIGNFLFNIVFYPITYRSEIGWKISKGIKFNAGSTFCSGLTISRVVSRRRRVRANRTPVPSSRGRRSSKKHRAPCSGPPGTANSSSSRSTAGASSPAFVSTSLATLVTPT
jgi:hypothetical protein